MIYFLISKFKIKYSEAEYFVGMQIERKRELRTLKVFQKAYVEKVLIIQTFLIAISIDSNVKFTKTIDTSEKNIELFPYKKVIGSLMFLVIITRPDLTFIVIVLN